MKAVLPITLLLLTTQLWAQHKFAPTVVVLSATKTEATDSILHQVSDYESETEITEEVRRSYVKEELAANWKISRTKELEFIQKQNFFSQVPYGISTQLAYRSVDNHKSPLIYPVTETSDITIASFSAIAKKYKVDWVVNPFQISLEEKDGDKLMVVRVIVYNLKTNRIHLDQSFTKGATNPGGTLECDAGSWQCSVNSILSVAVPEILHILEKNRHHWSHYE